MTTDANSGDFFVNLKRRLFLTVDAHKLFQKEKLDLNDCELADQFHSATGEAIKKFESQVFSKNKVKWSAEIIETAENEGYDITIDQIKMLPNSPANIFNKIILPGNNGKVEAKVKDLSKHEDYDYEIWFTLEDPSGNTKSFIIDPRLKASTTESYTALLINLFNSLPIDDMLRAKLLEVINDFRNQKN
ncbi:hypothetical protein ACT6NV_13065 [Robiginitalea sp. IMCC44478]|uniref:hypothetical protein n=1 Tax=Robiginitalea sp. IMCC44478 TaxID=3459122 RepID=UPI004041F206